MNLLLSVKDWFAQNWMLLLMVAILAFFVVSTFLKRKQEYNARNDLYASIKKGTKIVTTAGVYGVVESIEETTDGKVVTIKTGTSKNPSTMSIHINAIMGIDNKTAVKDKKVEHDEVEDVKESEVVSEDDATEEVEKKVTPKKKTSKKTDK